jgi:nucleoside-diphosphate-sugar epimerase
MRIIVTGATGNVGTSVVNALVADERVTEIVGIARRRPRLARPRTTWVQADVAQAPLDDVFRGADAVIHLAWLIQPSRDESVTYRTNVTGSRRVFEAVARAGVPALVHPSSIGAYNPPASDAPVHESWPADRPPPPV